MSVLLSHRKIAPVQETGSKITKALSGINRKNADCDLQEESKLRLASLARIDEYGKVGVHGEADF